MKIKRPRGHSPDCWCSHCCELMDPYQGQPRCPRCFLRGHTAEQCDLSILEFASSRRESSDSVYAEGLPIKHKVSHRKEPQKQAP